MANRMMRFRYGILAVLPSQFFCIADALVCIACLGYWHPGWEFKWYALCLGSEKARRWIGGKSGGR